MQGLEPCNFHLSQQAGRLFHNIEPVTLGLSPQLGGDDAGRKPKWKRLASFTTPSLEDSISPSSNPSKRSLDGSELLSPVHSKKAKTWCA
ncbi:hypothetical protein ACOSQ4_013707 [Xanthoceras sorbifolium]